jgi:hypothetical protein
MQEFYETRYGIYDHLSASNVRPLSSVALHPAEDFNAGSLLEEAIRTYTDKGILAQFGLNLVQFLDLPVDVVDILLTQATDEQAKKNTAMQKLEDQMKK